MQTRPEWSKEDRGPIIICYDQEPLDANFNHQLFLEITRRFDGPYILLNTEQTSDDKNAIIDNHKFIDVNYFHHLFVSADWYRGYQYDTAITDPKTRNINKLFISLNRITSNKRVYRLLQVAELAKRNLIEYGYVSLSKDCPDTGENFKDTIKNSKHYQVNTEDTIDILEKLNLPLLLDTASDKPIQNGSHTIGALKQSMDSLFFIVSETCYWENKTHLTEKIFKPIVLKMPFLLLGPAHNLKYLKSFGFKTFDKWIDESYDDIEDPVQRLHAVINVLDKLKNVDYNSLIREMSDVLEYNYRLFYNNTLIKSNWEQLKIDLKNSLQAAGVPLLYQKP